MMVSTKSLAAFVASTVCAAQVAAQACAAAGALPLSVKVGDGPALRAQAPKALFGFNVPWRDFQLAFLRGGQVRPEVIEWLKPFGGAVYRYPGGSPSNWFDWNDALGDMASRKPLHADHNRFARVEFGVTEFVQFLERVDGEAVLTVNLVGPYKQLRAAAELHSDGAAFAGLVGKLPAFECRSGSRCRLFAVELGNEVDWEPHAIGAADYVQRAASFRAGIGSALPNARYIANGRTAPWDKRAADYKRFNDVVAIGLAGQVAGLAVHPYYDGISVSRALQLVDEFAAVGDKGAPAVFVTEHARWPAQPLVGEWRQNWYQTTSLGGAISTADFLLGLIARPAVQLANWHALAGIGPWQLFEWDQKSDALTPSALYWGMRLLREAYLDDVLRSEFRSHQPARYGGGYDQRLVTMRSADGKRLSVLGINRAETALNVSFEWPRGMQPRALSLQWIGGGSVDSHNTAASPMQVVPLNAKPTAAERLFCVPGNSVFAIRFEN
jgi:hypothetical protein